MRQKLHSVSKSTKKFCSRVCDLHQLFHFSQLGSLEVIALGYFVMVDEIDFLAFVQHAKWHAHLFELPLHRKALLSNCFCALCGWFAFVVIPIHKVRKF